MFRLFSFSKKNKTKQDRKLISFIFRNFGYSPTDLTLFKKALTHKSFYENKESNERLEFLGDTVIDLIVADFLFFKFPNKNEGELTKIKSKIVSRRHLSIIGKNMNIRSVLLYHKGRRINLSTLEGNAFEAIIGAIYIDGGFLQAKHSVLHVFKKYTDLQKVLHEEIDFKSQLIIWGQKNKLSLSFEVIKEEKKDDQNIYTVVTIINGKELGRGTGSSKKKAEQIAAKETIELLG